MKLAHIVYDSPVDVVHSIIAICTLLWLTHMLHKEQPDHLSSPPRKAECHCQTTFFKKIVLAKLIEKPV